MKVANETGNSECAVIESFDGETSASKMVKLSDQMLAIEETEAVRAGNDGPPLGIACGEARGSARPRSGRAG